MLLMLAIRVGKSVFFYFNSELADIYMKIGLSACILIGPALYFYIKSVVSPEKKNRYWSAHFILLLAMAIFVGYSFPDTYDPKIGLFYWTYIIYFFWMAYIIASGFVLRQIFGKIFAKNEKLNGLDFWLLSVLVGNLTIWVAYRTVAYTSYIVGALSFSFIFYLLFLLIHFNRKKTSIFSTTTRYADKKIEKDEAKQLSEALKSLMETKNLYRDANLKLQDVAKELNIIPHRLSQLLNDNLNNSFTNYINGYRIKDAKNLIKNKSNLTFEAIAYECGFNSKSTFYAVFKKHVGLTPAQYMTKS